MKKLALALAAVMSSVVSFATDIGTVAEFVSAMSTDPAGSYTLTADIDMTGVAYTRPACFSGTLDGQGHTITGLSTQFCLTNAGSIASVIFDGTVSGANTKFSGVPVGAISIYASNSSYTNVVVKGYSLSTGFGCAGLYTGEAVGYLSFSRCATDSSCKILEGSKVNNNNGGFIGKISGITTADTIFYCCTNNAEMAKIGDYNPNQATAGFVGCARGGNVTSAGYPSLRFIKCVNNGLITANGGSGNLSGFVGMTEIQTATYNTGTFRIVLVDCVNNGNLDAKNYAVASACGFIAQLGGGVTFALTNCVNRGNIGGETSARSVGFVGWMASNICTMEDAKSVLVNCANYGAITGSRSAGLFGGGGTPSGAKNANVPAICNCANYGTITGSTYAGEFVGLAPQYFSLVLDNCYSETEDYIGNVEGTCTTNNVHGPYEEGYDATVACASLAARAVVYGWDKWWKVGKMSGKPELTQWSGDVYVICKVRYLDWDGTVLKVSDVEQGCSDIAPGKPSRTGYVFTGWDKSTECVMTDMDVTAQYRERVSGEIDCVADFISDITTNPAGSYVLTADLDFTGSGYATISSFSGTLNGGGNTVSGIGAQQLFDTVTGAIVNMTLNGATLSGLTSLSAQGVGILCNTADGAAFTNVVVRGYHLRHLGSNKGDYIGLFASSAKGGTEFVRCETGDDSSVGQANAQTNCGQGGFVGKVASSSDTGIIAAFIDCTNRAEIVYEASNGTDGWGSGGIVGRLLVGSSAGVAEVRFTRCVNYGTVNGQQCGGVVGYVTTASTPGIVRFENCVSRGAFGSKVMNAGGVVGKQQLTENTGIQMIFVDCVNYHSIEAASGSAGGIVGWMQGSRNNTAMSKMCFTNCTNYAKITVDGKAGGIVGYAKDGNIWGAKIDAIVCNCANYCSISGSTAGDIIGVLGPTSAGGCSTKGHVDNCFGISANAVGASEGCEEVSITNIKSSTDVGYTAAAAKSALNAVALEKGYGNWVLGKIGGDVVPELAAFCRKAYHGMVMIIR